MDEYKIALVPQQRKRRARLFFALLHRAQKAHRFLGRGSFAGVLKELPRGTAEAEHLGEDGRPFQRERNRRLSAVDFVFHVVFGSGPSFLRRRCRSAWKPRFAMRNSFGMSQIASARKTAIRTSMISG